MEILKNRATITYYDISKPIVYPDGINWIKFCPTSNLPLPNLPPTTTTLLVDCRHGTNLQQIPKSITRLFILGTYNYKLCIPNHITHFFMTGRYNKHYVISDSVKHLYISATAKFMPTLTSNIDYVNIFGYDVSNLRLNLLSFKISAYYLLRYQIYNYAGSKIDNPNSNYFKDLTTRCDINYNNRNKRRMPLYCMLLKN